MGACLGSCGPGHEATISTHGGVREWHIIPPVTPHARGPAAAMASIAGGGAVWAAGGVRRTFQILWGWWIRGCACRSYVGPDPGKAVRHPSDDRVHPCRIKYRKPEL